MAESRRIASLEWCKLFAILAVVYQHSVGQTSTLLTHFAVPAFTFISVYFATVAGARSKDPKNWLLFRSSKLYVLFLKWNFAYAILRWLSFAAAGTWRENAIKITPLEIFLTGCANAMFYIPFIIVANALGFSLAYAFRNSNKITTTVVGIVFLAIGIWLSFSVEFAENFKDLPWLDTHMVRKTMPAVALVISWYFFVKTGIVSTPSLPWLLLASLFFVATGVWHLIAIHRQNFYGENAAGLGIVLLFLGLAGLPWPDISPNLSLWIFVSHSFLLHGIRFLSKMIGHDYDYAPASIQITSAFLMMAILIGVYYALLDNSSQRRRWFLVG